MKKKMLLFFSTVATSTALPLMAISCNNEKEKSKNVEINNDKNVINIEARNALYSQIEKEDAKIATKQNEVNEKLELYKNQVQEAKTKYSIYAQKHNQAVQLQKQLQAEKAKAEPNQEEVTRLESAYNEALQARTDAVNEYKTLTANYQTSATEYTKLNDELATLIKDGLINKSVIAFSKNYQNRDIEITTKFISGVLTTFENYLSKNNLAGQSALTNEMKEIYLSTLTTWSNWLTKVDSSNLNVDSNAILKTALFDMDLIIGNLKSDYLSLNPKLWTSASYMFPITSYDNSLYRLSLSKAKNFAETAKIMKENLADSIKLNLVPSKVVIKLNMNGVIKNLFMAEVTKFIKSGAQTISVADLLTYKPAEDTSTTDEKLKEAKQAIYDFYKFYATEYYQAANHGLGENADSLILSLTNTTNEVENILEAFDNNQAVKIYGLGLSQSDLEAKAVGWNGANGIENHMSGKQAYDWMLNLASTKNGVTSEEVFDYGMSLIKENQALSKQVANLIADVIVGKGNEWQESFNYDADSNGPATPEQLTLVIRDAKGNLNWENFNKWLKSEEFQLGLEGSEVYTPEFKAALDANPNLTEIKNKLDNAGYGAWTNEQTANNPYGSITNKDAYYGALSTYLAFKQFKDSTTDKAAKFFNYEIPDYSLTPISFAKRELDGAAYYSNNQYYFNPDPYYGVAKWSISSLSNHEAVMGHHLQTTYYKHTSAQDPNLDAYVSQSGAYLEGWAVFMEMFGNEIGMYGEPDFNSQSYYALPKSFKVAKSGITSFYNGTFTEEALSQIKQLHNGIYWNLIASHNPNLSDEAKLAKAVELTNMLQYFGMLNEAQFRNVRLVVDTALHGKVKGNSEIQENASLQDIREFMQRYTALSVGQINTETKRYLLYPGQATAYILGKQVFEKMYNAVLAKTGLSREEFLNKTTEQEGEHGEVKKLFNYMLKYGSMPLSVLEETIKKAYDIE